MVALSIDLERKRSLIKFNSPHFHFNLQALVKKNQDLTPSQAEQTALSNLVTKIQTVLDNLIVSPGSFDACVSNNTINLGSQAATRDSSFF